MDKSIPVSECNYTTTLSGNARAVWYIVNFQKGDYISGQRGTCNRYEYIYLIKLFKFKDVSCEFDEFRVDIFILSRGEK